MTDNRQGLNTTLSYMAGKERRAYRVRTNMIAHGMKVLFDESASRTRRAFYPHRLTSAQFAIGIQLKGEEEYKSFSSWLATYADFILSVDLGFGDFPTMTVTVPSQDFMRRGVPLSGFEWGDRVGAMVWTPQVIFESAGEPLEKVAPRMSSMGNRKLIMNSKDVRFFYPLGEQLSGNQVPADGTYTQVVTWESMVALLAPASALTPGEAGRGYVASTAAEIADMNTPVAGGE